MGTSSAKNAWLLSKSCVANRTLLPLWRWCSGYESALVWSFTGAAWNGPWLGGKKTPSTHLQSLQPRRAVKWWQITKDCVAKFWHLSPINNEVPERSKNSNRAIHKDLQDKRKVACGLEP